MSEESESWGGSVGRHLNLILLSSVSNTSALGNKRAHVLKIVQRVMY